MSKKKILVVDDDAALCNLVESVLTPCGYEVLKAATGQEALKLLYSKRADLVLLDVVLPGLDGWQTCSRIRDISDVPVIMMTGKQTGEHDIVHGLECGADEYLLKPVGNRELVARVKAVLRRAEAAPSGEKGDDKSFTDEYLSIDLVRRNVMVDGKKVRLTPREYRLLATLLDNAGIVLTHRQILEGVWGWEYIDDIDYVRIYIAHLRKKIEPEPSNPGYILTEPGVGYYFAKKTRPEPASYHSRN